jgi:hypothetical protein
MKRVLNKKLSSVLAVVIVLFGFTINAHAIKIGAGLKGGLGLSNLVSGENSNVKLAGNLGAICDIQFNDWLACEVFLGWRNMGYRYDNGIINQRIELNYFHFEPVAKIYFSVSGHRLYALVGGYISGLMGTGEYKSAHTDIGFTIGIGVSLKLSEKFNLLIETNGNFGFTTQKSLGGGRNVAGYLSAGLLFDFN